MSGARTAWALTLAGAIPFVAAATLAILEDAGTVTPAVGSWQALIVFGTAEFYTPIIAAFMSGILWGFALQADRPAPWLVASVTPALALFFALALCTFYAQSVLPWVPILYFLLLLLFDRAFAHAELAPDWWMPLRFTVTTVVVVSLTLLAIFTPA